MDTTPKSGLHKKEMITAFYNYMAEVYIEYNLLETKPKAPIKTKPEIVNESQNQVEITDISNLDINVDMNVDVPDVPVKEPVQVMMEDQSFIDYFLYKLYFNYGVKRRMVNDHIALLYYHKSLKGYKSDDLITMICRHMMLDIRNMRIVSLGIPKAMKLDAFMAKYEINQDDATTNTQEIEDGSRIEKFRLYRFPEGTMMIYNPSLKKYNVDQYNSANPGDNGDNAGGDDDIDNSGDQLALESQTQKEIQQNIEAQFNEQFQQHFEYSTRRVVGTGRFNTTKTFMEMFNENNQIANTKLENIPDNVMQDKVLVFNIEHPENRIISPQTRNYNTLCAVYQLKSDDLATQQWQTLTYIPLTQIDNIRVGFNNFADGMVIQIHGATFKNQIECYNVGFHMPEVVKSFEKKNSETNSTDMIAITDITMASLQAMVAIRPKTFQGYIVYGANGERTKISNPQYKMLKQLKGNRPITIDHWNTKNLFYLYWRLVNENMVVEFIREFDIPGGWSYHQLFSWFANMTRAYSLHLFKCYHHSYVKKDMDRNLIPFSMKPMCGELHKLYMSNKVPISNTMVEQFIFSQPAGKVFWRLFSGK